MLSKYYENNPKLNSSWKATEDEMKIMIDKALVWKENMKSKKNQRNV